jgi:hypothetical protein
MFITYTSPLPEREELKARCFPSGEYNGRDSVAAWASSSRASPPPEGTVQISPPVTKAISLPSGEIPGSEKEDNALEDWPLPDSAVQESKKEQSPLKKIWEVIRKK